MMTLVLTVTFLKSSYKSPLACLSTIAHAKIQYLEIFSLNYPMPNTLVLSTVFEYPYSCEHFETFFLT